LITGANLHTNSRLDDYVRCRINPFMGSGKGGIPDGGNDQFIVTDLYAYDTIALTAPASSFLIQTFTSLPTTAALSAPPGATVLVNGNTFVANTQSSNSGTFAGTTVAAGSNGAYPLGRCQIYAGRSSVALTPSYLPGSAVVDPFSALSMRVVAIAYRLIYTGIAFECSGSITVTPNTTSFADVGPAGSGGTGTTAPSVATVQSPDGTTFTQRVMSGTPLVSWNAGPLPTFFNKDSVTFRPEQGVLFLPKHRTNDFKIKPVFDTPVGILWNTAPTQAATATSANYLNSLTMDINSATPGTAAYGGGIVWYDNDWSGITISATGINSGATFRWETVYCMEVVPQANSTVASMTRKAETERLSAIKQAQTIVNDMPTAVPLDPRR